MGRQRGSRAPPDRSRRAPEAHEILQLARLEIGYGPKAHAVLGPVDGVIAIANRRGGRVAGLIWPDIKVDQMLVAAIDERRDRAIVEIIEPAAQKRKFRGGKIFDRRREIELAVEPRLHRVLIGRDHVLEMARL